VSFAVITLFVPSQGVFIVVVYFVIDSVRKLLDTPSYMRAGDILKEDSSESSPLRCFH
jgi:enhancing lycopene biosynthesis protein 2